MMMVAFLLLPTSFCLGSTFVLPWFCFFAMGLRWFCDDAPMVIGASSERRQAGIDSPTEHGGLQ